LITEEIILISS